MYVCLCVGILKLPLSYHLLRYAMFDQKFGWRTTTTEHAYETKTRIGNWNERCFGIDQIQKQHQPKSQVIKEVE